MNYRHLPDTDLEVSAFCLGVLPFGGTLKDDDAQRMYDAFRGEGGNFFDTAHCYGFWTPAGHGSNERAFGKCVANRGDRSKIVIGTKGGHPDAGERYRRPDLYLSPEVIASDITDSLERLGTDYIDLYWLHRDDRRISAGEIIDTLNAEVSRGRIRFLGASNWTVERIAQANDYARQRGLRGFVASQPLWSLAKCNAEPATDIDTRYVTDQDAAWYAVHNVAVIPFSPTACGYFATGGLAGDKLFDNPVSKERLQRVQQMAQQTGYSANQVALAYLLCQQFCVIPILGTSKIDHLQDACGAIDLKLTPQQLRWLKDGGQ